MMRPRLSKVDTALIRRLPNRPRLQSSVAEPVALGHETLGLPEVTHAHDGAKGLLDGRHDRVAVAFAFGWLDEHVEPWPSPFDHFATRAETVGC